ncbi:MAG TPA: retropepsin-like aspartic protease [Bacteroidales bacterium]|nr:retropepsin-like aspartic protease [Bacteroidales bacterium]
MDKKRYQLPLDIIELDSNSCHILIEATINNLPCNLIIDTGASRTVFDRNFFEDQVEVLKVMTDDLRTAGIMADNIETVFARADSFSLSRFTMRDVRILLIDLYGINDVYESVTGRSIHGLVGSDFLYRHGAVIDFENRTLSLHA